jgi:hypothetical protein
MPDAGGIFTLVPSYLAVEGETIEVVNHNPPLEDIATALTNRLPRNGAAPMTGNLNAGGNKITNLAAGTAPGDAARLDQVVSSAFLSSVSALSLLANEMVYASGTNVAAKTAFTAAGRAVVGAADAAAQRAALGLGALATQAEVTTALFAPAALRTSAEGIASPLDTEVPTLKHVVDVAIPAFASRPIFWTAPVAMSTFTDREFTTVPAGVEEIWVEAWRFSLSGTEATFVQLGTGGAYVTTGYDAASTSGGGLNQQGFIFLTNTAASLYSMRMHLRRFDGNRWMAGHTGHVNLTGYAGFGSVDVGGVVDRIRIKTQAANTFDLGEVRFGYQIGN